MPITARFHRLPFLTLISRYVHISYSPKHRRVHRAEAESLAQSKCVLSLRGGPRLAPQQMKQWLKFYPVPRLPVVARTMCGPLP